MDAGEAGGPSSPDALLAIMGEWEPETLARTILDDLHLLAKPGDEEAASQQDDNPTGASVVVPSLAASFAHVWTQFRSSGGGARRDGRRWWA